MSVGVAYTWGVEHISRGLNCLFYVWGVAPGGGMLVPCVGGGIWGWHVSGVVQHVCGGWRGHQKGGMSVGVGGVINREACLWGWHICLSGGGMSGWVWQTGGRQHICGGDFGPCFAHVLRGWHLGRGDLTEYNQSLC